MSSELLSRDAATQRARSAVARFPSNLEDLCKIKMHPEKGYTSLVSLGFQLLSISCCFLHYFQLLIW